jgi:hypothetical protein
MTIFDFIADILFHKRKNTLSNVDSESLFIPFMVNRWVSMYSNTLALKSNLLNKYLILGKIPLYRLFLNIFDRVPTKKITYFKKIKEKKEENDKEILYAQAMELSLREIKNYTDILNSIKK